MVKDVLGWMWASCASKGLAEIPISAKEHNPYAYLYFVRAFAQKIDCD
jgi:hypothetical protein